MLTIFAIPKPYRDHIAVIQRNAIQSWLHLHPTPDVILFGDEPGVAEIAAEFKVQHIPTVARNAYGTPLLDDAFAHAQEVAQDGLICYVNGDILLLSDFMAGIQKIPFPRFLMIGQRLDIDTNVPIAFDLPDWEARLRAEVEARGRLQRFDYIDYFLFPKDSIGALPPFAVGRPGWDNWLIYRARALGLPVIDATQAITVVHQNHDYAHVPMRSGETWEGPEADQNRALMGGKPHRFYVTDATYKLTPGGLAKALDDVYLERRARRQLVLTNQRGPLVRLKVRAIGWIGRHRPWFPGWLWRSLIDRFGR